MPEKNRMSSVLVSRFSALGDIALTIPSLYEACEANPDCHFFMLTRKHPSSMFINPPENLTVVAVDFENYKGINGIWRLSQSLIRRYQIDTYVDLHDVLRTKLLRLFLRLQGVKVRHLNKGRRKKKALTRASHKIVVPLKTTVERYNDVFRKAGIVRKPTFKNIFGGKKGDTALFAAASAPKKESEKWLAVAPFARHKGKMYPLENLEKVIEHYNAKEGFRIFMFGAGEQEVLAIDGLAARYPSVVNVARSGIGIEGELALLSHCDVMLSMDSANMHLASLTGLRVVSVWGATHPFCGFMGWHQDEHDAVQLDMTCRPCSVFGNKPCARGDYHCLWGITPMMIIQKIDAGLSV